MKRLQDLMKRGTSISNSVVDFVLEDFPTSQDLVIKREERAEVPEI